MGTKDVSLEISGDSSPLIAALAEARAAVAESSAQMKEHLSSVAESASRLNEAFVAFGALLAGGGMFKEVVGATQEWTEAAISLSLVMGISTERASAYHVAIKEVGGNVADFDSAITHLTRQLKTHEKGLNDMGIATRDSSGKVLDAETIFWSAQEAVLQYKEGTDRNLAAQTAFGRGMDSTNAIFRLHRNEMDQAAETAKKLALIVGEDTVHAFEASRKSLADTSLKFEAMKIQVGNELIPVIVKLGEAFGGEATGAGKLLADVLEFLGKLVLALVGGVKEWIETFKGLGAAATAIMQGQFSEVGKIYDDTMAKIRGIDARYNALIAKLSMKSSVGIRVESLDGEDEKKDKGGKSFDLKPAEKADDKRLEQFKNELAKMSQARGDFDQKDYAADLDFWNAKLALTGKSTQGDKNLRVDIQKEILGLQRKQHDEEIKMQAEAIRTTEAMALGEVDAKHVALQQELALGKITLQQELQGEAALENDKFRIRQKSLADQLTLASADILAQRKLNDEGLKLEQKHAADVQKITNKAAVDERKTWDDLFSHMQSGFSSTIQGFLKGTQTLGSTIKGLFTSITDSIIQAVANMAAKWLATSLMQIVESKTSALAIITGLAAQAAAGAFAATAAIPYVGPALAPAAAATAYSETMAFSAVAVAAQGYDIPSNVNPVVQAHAKEMILPPEHAETIRALSRGGGGGGGLTVNISAIDSRSLQKALQHQGSSGALANAIRTLDKRFSR